MMNSGDSSLAPQRASGSRCVLLGVLGFTFASLLVFGSWAAGERFFYRTFGAAGAYALWALMFVGGGAWLLARLLSDPPDRGRFALAFVLAFLCYSFLWTASYMSLKHSTGEWAGSLIGTAGYVAVMRWMFPSKGAFLQAWLVLFALHSLGYFSGSALFTVLKHSTLSKMLWGVTYGAGMGAGIGWLAWMLRATSPPPVLASADGGAGIGRSPGR